MTTALCHFQTPSGPLCPSPARRVTPHLSEVDCGQCHQRFRGACRREERAWRRREDRQREQEVWSRFEQHARQVGLGDVWDYLDGDHSASGNFLRGLLGPIATYMVETGYPSPRSPTP